MLNQITTTKIQKSVDASGFSLVELMFTMTITMLILGLAFTLLSQSLGRKSREEAQAAAMADATLGMSRLSQEIMNAGFGLKSNGLVDADSGKDKIRVRANLNALMKQTTSTTVTDKNEDLSFSLVANPGGRSSLVRRDIGLGESSVVATEIDNTDIDNDGIGDGLLFTYFDAAGAEVNPSNAVRVQIALRITLPQVGVPGSPGFQPAATRVLTNSVVLRNANLPTY